MSIEVPKPIEEWRVQDYRNDAITALWKECGGPDWSEGSPHCYDFAGNMLQRAGADSPLPLLMRDFICEQVGERFKVESQPRSADGRPARAFIVDRKAPLPSGPEAVEKALAMTRRHATTSEVASLALAFADWKQKHG